LKILRPALISTPRHLKDFTRCAVHVFASRVACSPSSLARVVRVARTTMPVHEGTRGLVQSCVRAPCVIPPSRPSVAAYYLYCLYSCSTCQIAVHRPFRLDARREKGQTKRLYEKNNTNALVRAFKRSLIPKVLGPREQPMIKQTKYILSERNGSISLRDFLMDLLKRFVPYLY
jgi:hypothetical protein